MKILLKTLSFVWFFVWLYIGLSAVLETPDQIKSDKEFVKNEIKPSVDFINNFKETKNRLPTNREYYTWQRKYHNDYTSDLTQKEDSLIPGLGRIQYIRKITDIVSDDKEKLSGADWSKDYAIAVWRGEWMEYYFSWSDTYDTNNYSWKDGIIGLLFYIIMACVPLIFWFVYNKRKAHNNI